MTYRGVGVSFIAIASFLISSKYITAAIFGSNMEGWNAVMFEIVFRSSGNLLIILSVISLIIGVIYLVIAEVTYLKK